MLNPIDLKSDVEIEKFFKEGKLLYEDLRQSVLLCGVQPEVCWDNSPHCRVTYTLMCAFCLTRQERRESFNFTVNLKILLWSRHLAAIRSTILKSNGCNPYRPFIPLL